MLKWIGRKKGVEGIYNIPARDLTKEETEKYGGEKALLATGLYAKARGGKVKKSAKPIIHEPEAETASDKIDIVPNEQAETIFGLPVKMTDDPIVPDGEKLVIGSFNDLGKGFTDGE